MIAQQILTMQRAKAMGLKTFEFEGTKLSLRPTFCVFITMNPGEAGEGREEGGGNNGGEMEAGRGRVMRSPPYRMQRPPNAAHTLYRAHTH